MRVLWTRTWHGLRIKIGLAKRGPVCEVTYRNTCLLGVVKPLVINPLCGGDRSAMVTAFSKIVVNGRNAQGVPKGKGGAVQGDTLLRDRARAPPA